MNDTQISKFLSLVLRHKPETIDVQLDSAGWLSVETLLQGCAKHGYAITLERLQSVVANSDKKRFELSPDNTRIRASQGHSVDVELGYEAKEPPAILYHGTASRFADSIKAEGLKKMQRHHVHLTASIETASAVGQRYGKLALLTVDSEQMHKDGFVFYLSTNGVWLTDCVPAKYIRFSD